MKVKIVYDCNMMKLEEKINTFLESGDIEVVDIKLTSTSASECNCHNLVFALVMYKNK